MKILRNVVRCKKCNAEIESKIVGGLVICDCGKISIGGGKKILERYGNGTNFVEKSIIEVDYERKVK